MLLEAPLLRLVPVLILGGLLSAAGALAQSLPTPPSEREPNPADVRARERAAGVAPGSSAQSREAQAEDQIYRELLGQNPNAPGAARPPAPARTPGQDARATDQIFRELMTPTPAPSR